MPSDLSPVALCGLRRSRSISALNGRIDASSSFLAPSRLSVSPFSLRTLSLTPLAYRQPTRKPASVQTVHSFVLQSQPDSCLRISMIPLRLQDAVERVRGALESFVEDRADSG
uniref:Uncharacterized protein n=1 Tax=Tetraselmis chuii TaxID=63592 RepID=A0A7S1T698_9CHLO